MPSAFRHFMPIDYKSEAYSQAVSEGIRRAWAGMPFEKRGEEAKRKIVIQEQGGKCAKCGLDSWFEKPLRLQVHHKNGITNDDRRENLEALCPNCHSQTPNFSFYGRQHTPENRRKSIKKKFLSPGRPMQSQ